MEPEAHLARALSRKVFSNNADEASTNTFVAQTLDNFAKYEVRSILRSSATFYKDKWLNQALRVPYEAALDDYKSETKKILRTAQDSLGKRIIMSIPAYLQYMPSQPLHQIVDQMYKFAVIMYGDFYQTIRQIISNHEDRCELLVQTIRSFDFVASRLVPPIYLPATLPYIEPMIPQYQAFNMRGTPPLLFIEDDYSQKVLTQIDQIQGAINELLEFTNAYVVATRQSREQLAFSRRSSTGILLANRVDLRQSLVYRSSISYIPTAIVIRLKSSVEATIAAERAGLEMYFKQQLQQPRNQEFFDDIQKRFDESLRAINATCDIALRKAFNNVREAIEIGVKHMDKSRK